MALGGMERRDGGMASTHPQQAPMHVLSTNTPYFTQKPISRKSAAFCQTHHPIALSCLPPETSR